MGLVIMASELALGRKTGLGVVGAYQAVSKKFGWVGWLGVLSPFLIMSFYAVLGGYCIQYMSLNMAELSFNLSDIFGAPLAGGATFGAMLDNPFGCAVFTALFLFICMMIVKGGVAEGIEKFNKIGMPALFVMLVIVIIRSLTLPNAVEGLKYMFVPGYAVEAGFIEEAPNVISRAGHGGRSDVLLAVARDGRDGDLRLVSEQEGKHREELRRHRHRRHDRRADGGSRGHSGGGRQWHFERYPRQ